MSRPSKIALLNVVGAITLGRSGYDPVNGPVVGSDSIVEYIREIRADSSVESDRRSHRQPRRSVDGLRRDLARADDHQERRAEAPDRRLDVGPGGVRRVLRGHGGRRAGRAARNAHRARSGSTPASSSPAARSRRPAPTSRRPAKAGTPRSIHRTASSRTKSGPRCWSRCRRSTISSSKKPPRRGTRRPRKSIRSRRDGCGPASRPVRWGSWTSSVACRRRSASPSSARGSRAEEEVSWMVYPPRRSFYEVLSDQFDQPAAQRSTAESILTLLGPRDRRILSAHARAVAAVPIRRNPGAHAVRVSEVRTGQFPVASFQFKGPLSALRELRGACRRERARQRLLIDLDLQLFLRLHHVAAEEPIAPLVDQLLARLIDAGGQLRVGHRFLFDDADDGGALRRGDRIADAALAAARTRPCRCRR